MNMYKIVLDSNAIADSVAGVDLPDVNNSVSSLTSRTTALEKQIFAQIEWSSTQPVFGGVQTFPTNSEINFPWNRLVYSSSATLDVALEKKVIKLKQAGVYMLTGAWTHKADANFRLCQTRFRVNNVLQNTEISSGKTTELTGELAASPIELTAESQVFNFVTNISSAQTSAIGDGYAWVTMGLICSFAGQLTPLPNYNFMTVTKIT